MQAISQVAMTNAWNWITISFALTDTVKLAIT